MRVSILLGLFLLMILTTSVLMVDYDEVVTDVMEDDKNRNQIDDLNDPTSSSVVKTTSTRPARNRMRANKKKRPKKVRRIGKKNKKARKRKQRIFVVQRKAKKRLANLAVSQLDDESRPELLKIS
jgi:hypothetical protein